MLEALKPRGPLGWMLRVGASGSGGKGCGEEGLTWTKTEGEESETSRVFCFLLFSDFRDQWWAPQEQPSAQGNPRGDQSPPLSAPGPAPSLQLSSHGQPLQPGSGPHDCRQSAHGCCPDGHTASLGPQWQGCPGAASCQQGRWAPPPSPGQSRRVYLRGGGCLCSERVGWVSRTQERDSRAVVPELPSLGRTGDLASSPSH